MVNIISNNNRTKFIKEVVEKEAKEGVNFIVINQFDKHKDFLLVDDVINTLDVHSVIDNMCCEKTKIIVDIAESKTLEEECFSLLHHSLNNPIFIITNNADILKYLDAKERVRYIEWSKELNVKSIE